MRLCAVADVGPHLRAQNPLLPLPRLRRLAPSRRGGVRQSADPSRPARPDRVAGSYSPDRRPNAHSGRTRSAPWRSPRGGTDKAKARSPRARADTDQEKHGTVAYGLPGRSPVPRRTAPSDARTARPRAVHAGGTAGDPRSGRRPNIVPPPGRNPDRVPPAVTPVGGNAGNR